MSSLEIYRRALQNVKEELRVRMNEMSEVAVRTGEISDEHLDILETLMDNVHDLKRHIRWELEYEAKRAASEES